MKQTILLLVFVLFFIPACSSRVEPTPAQPSAFVVRELPSPTFTPVPSATFTPLPTNTATATFTPSPTSTTTPTLTPSPTLSPGPELSEIGRSVNNLPIEAVRVGNGPNTIIFIGGLNGYYAPTSMNLASQAISYFRDNPTQVPESMTVYVIEMANPDSLDLPRTIEGRLNANGVDLNRNWDCNWVSDAEVLDRVLRGSGGSQPFSEPESKSLFNLITSQNTVAVIIWSARAENGLVSPGGCNTNSAHSDSLANAYSRGTGYRVENFEDLAAQKISGDITNWLDAEGIAAITVLLPHLSSNIDWHNNLGGILTVLNYYGDESQ